MLQTRESTRFRRALAGVLLATILACGARTAHAQNVNGNRSVVTGPGAFYLFDWLTGNDASLHEQLTKFFKLDPHGFSTLTGIPDNGLRLENHGGSPSGIAWTPLSLRQPGLYTLRFEARGNEESTRASASFGGARITFPLNSNWAWHAATIQVPGPLGPATLSFTLHGRKGTLEVRRVRIVRIPFNARVTLHDGSLVLEVIGRAPADAHLRWRGAGTEVGDLGLGKLAWKEAAGLAFAPIPRPQAAVYEWTIERAAANDEHGLFTSETIVVGQRLRLQALPDLSRGSTPYAVDVRADGLVRVGGKGFLARGLYLHEDSQESIEQAAHAHLNLIVVPQTPHTAERVAFARSLGLEVIVETQIGADPSTLEENATKIVDSLKSLPLMAWYVVDEPDLKPEFEHVMDSIAQTMARLDGRPLYQANHSPQTFFSAGAACDILAIDPYPLSALPQPIASIGAWVDEARRAVGPGRSVWLIGQAFAEAPFWPTLPTPTQLNAMTWVALNHGARGIVYYALHEQLYPPTADHAFDLRQTDLWPEIARESAQIQSLEGFLTQEDGPRPLPSGGPIDAAMWVDHDQALIALVNSDDEDVDSIVNVPAGLSQLAIVGQENGRIQPRDGAFGIHMPAHGVLLLRGTVAIP